jgi:2-haloacid dehalogenase
MAITLAFDVYGTLIDTSGVIKALEQYAGDQARAFSGLWRDKQLEYSFRRGLMQNYQDFSVCTRNALDYACSLFHIEISQSDKDKLLAGYRILPTFHDVKEALEMLASAGINMFALSNGRAGDVAGLLKNADIERYFTDVVSVDEIRSFKPDPAVYHHFLQRAKTKGNQAWLISGNPFDVIGAVSAGMRAAWVKRSADMIFDPWDIEPTITVSDLKELKGALLAFNDGA